MLDIPRLITEERCVAPTICDLDDHRQTVLPIRGNLPRGLHINGSMGIVGAHLPELVLGSVRGAEDNDHAFRRLHRRRHELGNDSAAMRARGFVPVV
ncbi:hypothetical protein PG994_001380 [Apiospora phragmitis]|uniref:Uncharacterized protein n=1 Tax=Apiospora phragmitis TaxID=2905665 RepID=A0ABR1WTB2_9PEZI